jgi:xanthosine utilization system XapX-like protein
VLAEQDHFTLRHRGVVIWLAGVVAATVAVCVVAPPAFWICGLGGLLLGAGLIANSSRTRQWMSWENEGKLNWFEGWAAASGAVMLVVPLALVLLRNAIG